MENTNQNSETKIPRPPVIVVMGHIDHGKTTLLDYIRKTNVAGKESGGITQHIGAYEIVHNGRRITFLDTPGHEAFSKIRVRGAKVADLAILVVAADDGVKPQTVEAINHIQKAGLSFLVAINKIDKPQANSEKVKKELAENNILLESWGGQVPSVEISAKDGTNIDKLLDLIELLGEMADLKADTNALASGVILETHLDSRRGITVSALILDGTLRIGDFVWTVSARGKVKILEDFMGKAIREAIFSSPVSVLGFENMPEVGEEFKTGSELPGFVSAATRKPQAVSLETSEKTIPVVIKADVQSSAEALGDILKAMKFSGGSIQILKQDVGPVGESDVKLVLPGRGIVVAFRVKTDLAAQNLIRSGEIKMIYGDIIYEIIDVLKKEIEGRLEAEKEREDFGKLQVLAVFRQDKNQQLVGGKVTEGRILKGSRIDISRNEILLGQGRIVSLQKEKKDISEVESGNEAGLIVESDVKIAKNDVLASFKSLK